MNILFLHSSFPGQFKHLLVELEKNPENKILFIQEKSELKSVKFKPDVIYGHPFGPLKEAIETFSDVPFIYYCEWFYDAECEKEFDGRSLSEETKAKLRKRNEEILFFLRYCKAGITPTNWQKSQFPKEFQDKIAVLHEGVDTDICKPDSEAKFLIKEKNLELSGRDEVITYATRGLEPYRGFPVFMKAVEQLLKMRPKAHFVIAGEDDVFYGSKLTEGTYKEVMLKNTEIDLNRVHFTGKLPFNEYIKLLQISSVHVYLTYPFVLSWSVLEAMSIGCCIVASNTPPVTEIIKDNYNGFLFDFYNLNQLINQIIYALDNKTKMQVIRTNARKAVLDNYSTKILLQKHLEFIKNCKLQSG